MRRFWKWALAAGILLLALCSAAYWRERERAKAVIAKHRAAAASAVEKLAGSFVPRPPLAFWPAERPESERPGDARLIYDRVLAKIDAIPESDFDILPEHLYLRADEIDEQAIRAFVASHASIIEDLREALYAEGMSHDPSLAEGFERQADMTNRWFKLANFLEGASRNALVLGEDKAAVPLVSLRLCLGQDIARSGVVLEWLVGMGITAGVFDHARLLMARQVLSAEDLAGLELSLDRLAANRPSLEARWEAEGHFILWVFSGLQGDSLLDVEPKVGWVHFFSTKVWLADALERLAPLHGRIGALSRLPGLEARDATQKMFDDLPTERDHALTKMVLAVAPLVFKRRAVLEMRWHLMRTSVALAQHRARHGRWPDHLDELVPAYLPRLDVCPLSNAPLGYSAGKVWSIGGDGDDDGGRPIRKESEFDSDGDAVFDLNDTTAP